MSAPVEQAQVNAAYLAWLIALPLVLSPVVYLAGRLWRLARGTALIALVATWVPFALAARDLSAS